MPKEYKNPLWKVEMRRIGDLIPNPKNPRTITDESLKGLRESIKTNGYTDYIIVQNDNMILSGHARQLVLCEMFGKDVIVPVQVATRKLTNDEINSALLGHNSIGGRWNIDELQLNFAPIDLERFNIKFDISAPVEVEAPEIPENKPDNNTMTLNFTNDEFETVNRAIAEARDYLEIDPDSKPIPGAIVAICKEFLRLQESD